MNFHEHQIKAYFLWLDAVRSHGIDFGPWFYWFEAQGQHPYPPPIE